MCAKPSDTDLPGWWDARERTSTSEVRADDKTISGTMFPAPSLRSGARLIVLAGRETGRRYRLSGSLVLGRSDECDVQLDDTRVSRRHASLTRDGDQWVLEDLGSRNGTLVNGERLTGRRALAFGDRVQLSPETVLVFAREDPLEDRLLHLQQMEVIGQLAAGTAHDFNNLLNVIAAGVSHVGTLDPSTPLGDADVRECLDDIRSAATRAADLTGRLLTIARRDSGGIGSSKQRVDVSALAEEVLALVRRTFDRSIRIESRIDPDLVVVGDYAALHQVLMNLCINARDAMPQGGTLSVVAERAQVPGVPGPPHVVITVRDTGVGMDEQTRSRVFEPFFTTKARGTGSGLGLATAYEVVTSHGGAIEVESAKGKGAAFTVRLPAAAPQAERAGRRERAARPKTQDGGALDPGRAARVLIVDDEELVRRGLGRLVRAAGYEVLFAADGRQALAIYTSERRPDLVLLDLDMPNLSGAETLVHLKRIDPGARVVLVSGYYDEGRKRHLLARGALEFLPKPVDAVKLREAIRIGLQVPVPL